MNFLLAKAVPYILTFMAGAGVFAVSTYLPTDWSPWLVEISGALSAIPIVFLIYEYTEYLTARSVNKKLFDNISFEINSIVLKILRFYKRSLGVRSEMTFRVAEKMLIRTAHDMEKSLKITKNDIAELKLFKKDFDALIYPAASSNIFNDQQIELIITIPRTLARIINELEYRGKRAELARYTENLFSLLTTWFDTYEEEALKSHEDFQLVEERLGKPGPLKRVRRLK